jgi:hypothetical protein
MGVQVARYYLHLRDGIDELLDPDGLEFADIDAVKKAVLFSARDMIAGDVRNGIIDLRYRIDAESADGDVVYSLKFKHAFNLVPEAG